MSNDEYIASLNFEKMKAQAEFRSKIHQALERTRRFASDVEQSLGEISIAEAKLGIAAFFLDELK